MLVAKCIIPWQLAEIIKSRIKHSKFSKVDKQLTHKYGNNKNETSKRRLYLHLSQMTRQVYTTERSSDNH